MNRRLLSPGGMGAAFALVAALVVGGLAWVTVASLRVEYAQREATARAARLNKERLALWRLDGEMLPVMALEGNRPFAHYAALNDAYPAVDLAANGTGAVRLPSPLLSADLPPWMILHFQLDAQGGWQSPQVLPADVADRLRSAPLNLSLTNVTPERERALDELAAKLAPTAAVRAFAERVGPDDDPLTFAEPLTDLAGVKSSGTIGDGIKPDANAPVPPADNFAPQSAPAAPPAASLSMHIPPPAPEANFGAAQVPAQDFTRQYNSDRPSEPLDRLRADPAPPKDARGEQAYRYQLSQKVQEMNRGVNDYLGNSLNSAVPPPAGPNGAADAPKAAEKSLEFKQNAVPTFAMGGATGQPNRAALADADGADRDAKSKADRGREEAGKSGEPMGGSIAGGRGGFAKALEDTARKKELAPTAGRPAGGFGGGFAASGMAGPAASNAPGGMPTPTSGPVPAPMTMFSGPPPAPAPGAGAEPGYSVPPPAPPQPSEVALGAVAATAAIPAPPTEPQRGVVFDAAPAERKPAAPSRPAAVHLGPLRPQWLTAADGTEFLVLVRPARLEDRTVYQGILLDWPRLQDTLRAQVTDLFPDAKLTPIRAADAPAPEERAMTALPVELDPGPEPEPPPAGWTPLRVGLALAWAAALVALAAVGVGGASLVALSERRIRFVSAVTHELRTPLTSLRLYLDLLASGMVSDEQKQKEYIATLAVESERLHRLIENVLDFARLEKRAAQAHVQPTPVTDLLEEVRQTWAERCAADGKELLVISTVPADMRVATDPRVAAQVIGNLVDNARKYARDAADGRIWVWAKPGDRGRVAVEVEDRGPGVPARDRGGLFRPFRRGRDADTQAGGAGLGLALAKQWSELLGGRLAYRPADGGTGACFRLELPGA